jgi:pSer/pThr/pTyr-binding forkhead associated (FHA) protein
VPATFVFCGACGNRLEPMGAGGPAAMPGGMGLGMPERSGMTDQLAAQVAPIAEPKPRGRLTLIRPDGTEGGTHDLEEGENQIGRSHGPVFENDGYLSPRHAEIVINAAGAVIRDLDSLNGVFVKMTNEEELSSGDVFRIGQELLRFDVITPPQPLEDGTEVMGSPNPGYWGRLSVIIGKDIDGSAYPLFGDAMVIGRERGDINFPDDGYVSGVHARISNREGKSYIVDLGSSNGSFVRLRGERMVQDGTFVLFGQQLFRVNLSIS